MNLNKRTLPQCIFYFVMQTLPSSALGEKRIRIGYSEKKGCVVHTIRVQEDMGLWIGVKRTHKNHTDTQT